MKEEYTLLLVMSERPVGKKDDTIPMTLFPEGNGCKKQFLGKLKEILTFFHLTSVGPVEFEEL